MGHEMDAINHDWLVEERMRLIARVDELQQACNDNVERRRLAERKVRDLSQAILSVLRDPMAIEPWGMLKAIALIVHSDAADVDAKEES